MNSTDLAIFRVIYSGFRSPASDVLFALLSTSALGWLMFVASIPLLWNRTWRFDALRHMAAVILSSSAPALKAFIEHDRPSKMLWVRPQETFFEGSFPSGHTAAAFVVAVNWSFVLARRGQSKWIPLLLAWAFLVAVSRIYRGVHWPSDVLGGALLGTALALALDYAWPRDRSTEVQPTDP